MMTEIAKKPREIFRAHPIYGWTLTPGRRVSVRFRPGITQSIDEDGNRRVPPNPQAEVVTHRLNIYGCSFTYGTGLADDETYAALLQQRLPEARITNKGVGGHSNVQSLLRFRDDIRSGQVDAAIFSIISDHRYRNLPHPKRMKAHLSPDWYRIGVEHVPHARLNRSGEIGIRFTPIWQPSLLGADFSIFLPDQHVLDLVALGILEQTVKLAKTSEIPIIIALLDQLDPEFNELVTNRFEMAHDISTPYDAEHNFIPTDIHPNQRANRRFAERLLPLIKTELGLGSHD